MTPAALSGAAAIALSLAAPAAAEEITVFAASSLTNAMTEIEAGFEAATCRRWWPPVPKGCQLPT